MQFPKNNTVIKNLNYFIAKTAIEAGKSRAQLKFLMRLVLHNRLDTNYTPSMTADGFTYISPTLLMIAVQHDSRHAVDYLLDSKFYPAIVDLHCKDPSRQVEKLGHNLLADQHIELDFPVRCPFSLWTALDYAVEAESHEVVQILLDAGALIKEGADVAVIEHWAHSGYVVGNQYRCVQLAVQRKNKRILCLMLMYMRDPRFRYKESDVVKVVNIALEEAAILGYADILDFLLNFELYEDDLKQKIKNAKLSNALAQAVRFQVDCYYLLKVLVAGIHVRLFSSSFSAKCILQQILKKDRHNQTQVWNNHEDCVKLLLDSGLSPSGCIIDRVTRAHPKGVIVFGFPALHLAAAANNTKLVKMLLDAGCDINILCADDRELNALHYIFQETNEGYPIPFDTVQQLIDAGIDVNKATPKGGNPPLLEFARVVHYSTTVSPADVERITRMLCEAGADPMKKATVSNGPNYTVIQHVMHMKNKHRHTLFKVFREFGYRC